MPNVLRLLGIGRQFGFDERFVQRIFKFSKNPAVTIEVNFSPSTSLRLVIRQREQISWNIYLSAAVHFDSLRANLHLSGRGALMQSPEPFA
ncbi:hypothetical protein EMIT0158MI4_100314 [Burkholderia ambifaria]